MAVAELTLFGGFGVQEPSDAAISLLGQKERALLAFLALAPGTTHSREKLASLLWSDRGDLQARDSLKHALTSLRQCLQSTGSAAIIADRLSVRLDPAAVATDVAAFERLLSAGTPQAIEQAAALYRGDLLDGVIIRDAAFEEWLLLERQRLRRLLEEALATLVTRAMAAGERERAEAAARRLLALDPLREAASRALMRLHAQRGEAAQALKLYEGLRERLQRELGAKPEPETTQLYESIREHRTAPPAPPPERSATTPPPLPDKPSVAVLPFENLSGDPEQQYFSDGITEDIIIELSRFRSLFVIARNSSFAFKGKSIKVQDIARELGVAYIVEGSVRKAASRVRISGQLINGSTGAHLWAGRFEGALEDIFDMQDQVTASVVGAIAPRLEQAEIERAKRKPTESLDAYDHYLRGMASLHQWTKESTSDVLRMFYRAIELDPDFASAHGVAAYCYCLRMVNRWMTDRERETAETARLARRAVELGRDDAGALSTGGIALAFVVGDLDDGAAFIDQALALNPNLAAAWYYSGWARVYLGEPDTAIEHFARAMRQSPLDMLIGRMQTGTAHAHFFAGRYDMASSWAGMALRTSPYYLDAWHIATGSHALAGRLDQAQKALARLRQLDPALRVSNLRDMIGPYRRPEDVARYEEGLRKAGLPE